MYFVSVTIHVLAAMLWVGGMVFLGVVGAPVLRAVEPAELRQRLFQAIGVRFRAIGWGAIAVLLVTGVVNLHYRGWLTWDGLTSAAFWRSDQGRVLALKLLAVVAMMIVSAVHDFFLGPAASRVSAGSTDALGLRRRAAVVARVNAIIAIIVVIAAVRLAR